MKKEEEENNNDKKQSQPKLRLNTQTFRFWALLKL